MTEERLSGLAILSIENQRAQAANGVVDGETARNKYRDGSYNLRVGTSFFTLICCSKPRALPRTSYRASHLKPVGASSRHLKRGLAFTPLLGMAIASRCSFIIQKPPNLSITEDSERRTIGYVEVQPEGVQDLPLQVLFVLDNAPVYPPNREDDIHVEFKFIKVLYRPPNTTPILQPMD
ncbi:hypothetical protein CBL_00348 [Carabus blaptoides fortunei]